MWSHTFNCIQSIQPRDLSIFLCLHLMTIIPLLWATLRPLPMDTVGSLRFLTCRSYPSSYSYNSLTTGSAAANSTVDHVRGADHIGRSLNY